MNIYVGNLSYNTTSSDLESAFSQHGTVSTARVATDKYTGKSRGFGFVEMPDNNEARKAIDAMNGRDLDGRTLNVNEAKPREDRGGDRGGERRYSDRGGDRRSNSRW